MRYGDMGIVYCKSKTKLNKNVHLNKNLFSCPSSVLDPVMSESQIVPVLITSIAPVHSTHKEKLDK